MTVSLKYGVYAGQALNWSSPENFNALVFTEFPETEKVAGRSLRKIEYAHLLSKRKKYKITISADELMNDDKMSFITEFYLAQVWKFSVDNWTTETEAVIMEQGQMPLSFINNNKYLPELTIFLVEKIPTE
jgi:hypothetical protein